jgi:hypothetical protein
MDQGDIFDDNQLDDFGLARKARCILVIPLPTVRVLRIR